jgi:hypothetical protein
MVEDSPHETASIGPLVPETLKNTTASGSAANGPEPAQQAELVGQQDGGKGRTEQGTPRPDSSGGVGTVARGGGAETVGKRAVSYINLHMLAPLSEMVVHYENVTTWACATSWKDAEDVAREALLLAESEGPQPVRSSPKICFLVWNGFV